MNTLLVSLMWEICNLGSLNLSTLLRERGHRAIDVFLTCGKQEDQNDVEQLAALIEREQIRLVGLSLMTLNFERAAWLTRQLHERFADLPIVWGGVHPTIAPEQCLEHADAVVQGEGEGALLDVVAALERGADLAGIPNVALRRNGELLRSDLRAPEQQLDRFPFPRFEFDAAYVRDQGLLKPLNLELYRKNVVRAGVIYDVMMTRGCPFNCTYCCNWTFRKLYQGKGPLLRSRSVDHVMHEIDWATRTFPFVRLINMQDDSFLSADEQVIEEFAAKFKQRGLTLICKALPTYISERKLRLLRDAGLEHIQIGLQGSQRANREIYRRAVSHEDFLRATQLIRKLGIAGRYDVIVDNPWETDRDRLQLVRTLLKTPRPYWLNIFPLAYFPGTQIAAMAQRDGIDVGDSDGYSYFYGKPRRDFFNLLIQVVPRISPWLAELLIRNRDKRLAFLLLAFYAERWDKSRLELMKWVSARPRLMKLAKRIYFLVKR
ncbi:MAG: radical SAM protein [Candidatus Alcyoniella australis]|nr:radical SAM protein [Candidatus Alcyoniella australis]